MTYARARLWIGISGVGTFVVLASLLLVTGWPTAYLSHLGGSPLADARALATVLGASALLALPFDLLGGLILPRRFGRSKISTLGFLRRWSRGVVALGLFSVVTGTVLLAAGRAGGRPVALLAFVAIAALLMFFQEPLARLVGGLRRVTTEKLRARGVEPGRLILLEGSDPGFSGGFAGVSATAVLPARWVRELEPRALALLLERRRRILKSGAWRRAVVLAVVWNATGFVAASLLPGAGVTSVAELVSTALGFTLWTFLGLLILPTPSRRATEVADGLVATDSESRARLASAVETIDRLGDDEPERSPGLESVFHPVPSVASRLRAMESPRPGRRGLWHLARTALYLSQAGLSLLPRAVHCNAGRPELWVYMPTDG